MCKKELFVFLLLCTSTLFSQAFTDITTASGINHIYKQAFEMGGGAVFFDYDNDGWEDIYITAGKDKDQLYQNLGNGNFQLVSAPWLNITQDFYTVAVVSGDVNNDGYRDLFVTTWRGEDNNGPLERNLLFMNNGDGTFSETGLNSGLSEVGFSMGTAMLDYNNDGFLDIYVVNYIENSVPLYNDSGEVNGFDHDCYANSFYKNNGDGTFTEMATTLGVGNNGCALAVMPTDYDQDNDQDIYVANDFGEFVVANALLENNYPTNSFTDVSVATNMDVGIYGMGIAYADFDKDGDFDYYITNLGRNVLIQNDGSQNFSDISTSASVENTYTENSSNTLLSTSWGTVFLDVNNDTWPDLFVGNGRIPAASFIATGEDDPNKLYINNGDATFTDISDMAGVNDYNRGRGVAYSDYDKDGDLDVLVVVQDGTASTTAKTVLYRNEINPTGSDGKNWTQIELKGVAINKDAIGAKVELTVNGEKLIQEVHGQGSHASQSSLILHFGLGANTIIDEVKVIWSSADTQTFTNLQANTRFQITQGGSPLSIDKNELNAFLIYPNPVKNELHFSGISSKKTIKIYSVYGSLLDTIEITERTTSVNLENYKTGVYLVQIFSEDNSLAKSRLIVKK